MADRNRRPRPVHERQRIKKRYNITEKARKANPIVKAVKATTKLIPKPDKKKEENSGSNTVVPLIKRVDKDKVKTPSIDVSNVPQIKQPTVNRSLPDNAKDLRNHFQKGLEERRKKEREAEIKKKREERLFHKDKDIFEGSYLDNVPSPFTKGYSLADEIQVSKDVSDMLQQKLPRQEAQDYMGLINDVFAGKYAYGVKDDDFKEWEKNYTFKVRKKNPETGEFYETRMFKADAPPPPTGISEEVYKAWEAKNTYEYKDENGDVKHILNDDAEPMPQGKQDIRDAWRYFLAQQRHTDLEVADQQEKMQHLAGTNPERADSFLDVIRDDLSGRKNLVSGTIDYFRDYIANPLRNHDWGTLGMNVLMNLGETMDVFGVGARALYANSYYLEGGKSKLVSGQKGFVYSGGLDKQKQILKIRGAEALLNGKHGRGRTYNTYTEEALKEAGLWDDFNKLRQEWSNRGRPGDFGENLLKAYTTHENFDPDTGNPIADLAVGVVMDPSLVVGGLAKAGASVGAKAGAKAGLEAGLEYLTKDGVDWITDGNKVLKQFYKNAGKGMIMDNTSSIDKAVENLSRVMANEGHVSADNVAKFEAAVKEGLHNIKADQSYQFIRSLNRLDSFVDRVDSALLKTSFAVPYVPVKAILGTKKVLRSTKVVSERLGTKKGGKILTAFQKQVEGIRKRDGSVSIGDLGEFLKRMDESDVGRSDDIFRSNTIKKFVQQARVDAADIQRLVQRIEKESYDPDYIDNVVSDMISTITDGKVTTGSEFLDYIDNVFQTHVGKLNGELDEIRDIYTKQLEAIENIKEANVKNFVNDFSKRLSEVNTFEDIQNLTMDYVRFEKSVDNPDQFVKGLVDRANEFEGGVFSDPKDILRDFEYRNATSVKSADSKLIKGLMDNMDKTSKGFNVLSKNMELKVVELGKRVDVNSELGKYLMPEGKALKISDIDPLELHSKCSEFIQDFLIKSEFGRTDIEGVNDIVKYVQEFDKQLVNEQLSVVVKQDMEIINAHVDSFRIFDRYMNDSRFNHIIDSLTGKDGILSDLELLKKNISNQDYKKLSEVQSQVQVLQAYNYFQAQLRRIPGITDEQFYTIIDSVFGLTKGNPSDYYVKASRSLDNFIRKVNLNLNTLYGDTRVNLDGFRKEALDFDSDLYKDFSDEIKDEDLQNRIKEIMKDGHLNPGQDVDVQMLQVILRDKGAIDYYNNLAKRQDVLFTDIETQGLNSDLHSITAISSKKWNPDIITSDSSLDEIISYIENNKPNTYTTKSLSEDIDKTISDSTLDGLFRNDSRLGSNAKRSEMLDKYKEFYAVKEGEEIVSEVEVLQRFIQDLDKSYDSMGEQVPVLVTHSTEGFDVNFISKRLSYYEAFPNHIVQTQDLINASQSTVERLVGLTNDHILTTTQASMIQDSLSTLARTLDSTSPGTGFKLLEPRTFDELFNISDDLRSRYGINDFQEDFIALNKDINSESRVFNGSIMIDPFRNGGEIDSNFMKFYETVIGRSRQELDNLFRANREVDPDSLIPDIGYNVIFSTKDNRSVTRYFDIVDGDQIVVPNLFKINDFTKSVDNIIRFNLKRNILIEDHFDDFQSIINYAKEYAQDLTDNDPLVYLKYIKNPETVYEAYAMAQVIWDKTLKYVDDDLLKKNAELYKGIDGVDDNVRDYVLNYVLSNKTFDIKEVVSDDTLRILKGEFDTIIRKNELPDVYSEKLMNVKGIDNAMDLRAYQATLDQQMRAVTTPYTGGLEQIVSDAKQFRIAQTYQKLLNVTDYIKAIDDAGDEKALSKILDNLKNIDRVRRDAMSAQIMEHLLESDEALVSHLLFHNQLLIISTRGSDLHMSQVQRLIDRMSKAGDDAHYIYHVENDQLFIGLKNDRKLEIVDDSSYVKEDTKMRIRGDDTVYTAPKYKSVDFPVHSELDRMIKDVYDEIDFLTEGKSIGSIGTLHTLSRHKMLLKSLPEGFAKNILSSEYTCDARFWHQASFDLTRIGDTENVYKFTDFNDTDTLLSLHKTLEQVAGSASAERSYLDYFFGDNAAGRVSDLMADLSDEEKIACIKNNPDMACVSLQAVDTKMFGAMESTTGFEVHKLDINDVTDLRIAESSGAVMVPYEVYLDMEEVFNKSTFVKDPDSTLVKGWSTFLKGWTKVIWLYKVGQLCSPGTWIRNWMDATMKMTGDTGSAGQTARYQLKAMELLINYKRAFRSVKKDLDLKYTTEGDIKRMFDLSPDKQIHGLTYDQFQFIEDWLNVSISGGESRIVKSITDYSDEAINLNVALKPGRTDSRKNILELKQEFDLIGDKYTRFEELEEAEVLDLCNSFNYRLFDKMDKDRFMEVWRTGREGISDEELLQYNQIVNELIRKRFKRIRGDRTVVGVAERLVNGTFTPMSAVEEVVRFGEYLALEGQGFTKNEIFQKIEASQFNYDTKTMRTKQIEMLVGYYGFMDANIHYWCRQLVENPRMLRYIEHIYGELSWDAAFEMGEDPEENKSLAYMMQNGGIPIGDSGIYLKANPSFLDPLKILLGDPDTLVNTLLPPYQTGINMLSNSCGEEYSALFHDLLNSNNGKSLRDQLIEATPIAGSFKTRYWDTWLEKKPWQRIQGDNKLAKFFVTIDPSTFGAVKRYKNQERDEWDAFQKKLAEQGRWYDSNLRKVVSLDKYNETGLNNPLLSWDERAREMFIRFGLLWDNNQGDFVEPGQYRLGGLNRSWNFDNDGEWEEFCKLKKRMTGKVWDNNQRKFVTPDEVIPGMLNNDNLTWDEVQKYNEELFGTKWDNNQGKFVDKDHYIEGGLNSDDLSFQELCTLRYAVFGEEWDQGAHKFVKTTAPVVLYDLPPEDIEKTTRLDRTDEKVSMLERLGLISTAHAALGDDVVPGRKGLKGKYVFTGNPMQDSMTLTKILRDFAGVAPSWGGYRRFGRWRNFHWRKFNSGYGQFADVPEAGYKKPSTVKFSRPYTSGGEYAALRMALYGYKTYEDYYKFDYQYNYNYRSPNAGPKKYEGSLYSRNMRLGDFNKWTYYRR